jgi:asparaginyl-tRNA synthetase
MILRRFACTTAYRRLPPTIKQLLANNDSIGTAVTVSGFVKSVRKQKRVAFAAVSDGTSADVLQAVFQPELAKAYEFNFKMVGVRF